MSGQLPVKSKTIPFGHQLAFCVAGLALGLLPACESWFVHAGADAGSADAKGDAGSVPVFAGAAIGGACGDTTECRQGLTCQAKTCQPGHQTPANGACLLTAECATGLSCGWSGFCTAQPAGPGKVGEDCAKTADCSGGLFCKFKAASQCPSGSTCGLCTVPDAANVASEGEECTTAAACPPDMVCEMIGLSGVCKLATGAGDIGAPCAKAKDCLAGLACSTNQKACVPGSLLLEPDLYSGVECADDAEAAAPFSAIVHIARAATGTDFFSLPYPNDILLKNGHVDLSQHPHPGLGLIGFDSVAATAAEVSQEMTGFGLTTGMYVRFTRAIDPASLKTGSGGNVRLINLNTGADLPVNAHFQPARNKYICANWLYLHTPWAQVLEPNTAYAFVVTDGVALGKDATGKVLPGPAIPVQSADMKLLLSATPPADLQLTAAWSAYSKLRTWVAKNGLNPDKVVAGSVFTTWEPRQRTHDLAALAQNNGDHVPAVDGAVFACNAPGLHDDKTGCATPDYKLTDLGKAGMPDPRDCPANLDKHYTEYHLRLKMPYYQEGTRPYLKEGGAIKLDDKGKPVIVGSESVCVSINVPSGAMPANGWPLLVFGHGTGGSFRSVNDQVSNWVANMDNGAQWATIGIDAPMHADRRGIDPATGKTYTTDPGPLFYNFANPQAARGNFYQGAMDNISLYRFAGSFKGGNGLPGLKFDAAHFAYMGHSQGGTTGPIFAPYQKGLSGAVFSGCGGSLVFGLLGKKKPYDASIGLQIALQDAQMDEFHPVLNLLQFYFEAADPLLYAAMMTQAPVADGAGPVKLLHTFGQGDSYTPPLTSAIFAAATGNTLGLPAGNLPTWFDKVDKLSVTATPMKTAPLSPPIAQNVQAGAQKVTAVSIQALNDASKSLYQSAYDGHFVAFNDIDTVARVKHFLATLAIGKPEVGP